MANDMLLDDTRALRREQREARIARKRDRRQARDLKRQRNTLPPLTAPLARENTAVTPAAEPVAEMAPAASAQPTAPVPAPAVQIAAPAQPSNPHPTSEEREPKRSRPAERAARSPRRERDVAEFLARREQAVSFARNEARERIEHCGEEKAVRDALVELARAEASPWHRHRERLAETVTSGRVPDVGAAARRACHGTASDAARTSRRAPDPQRALAVTVAYAVIAQAPWAAIEIERAARFAQRLQQCGNRLSTLGSRPLPRAFWR